MAKVNAPGTIGLPETFKEPGKRVDFKTNAALQTDFDFLIETKGTRYGWARAARCPCEGLNEQTKQVDPSCPNCNGKGFLYFKPSDYAQTAEVGTLSSVQTAMLNLTEAVVIRGWMQGLTQQPDMFAVLGRWAMGTALFTTRFPNHLGYYDRIIDLDGKRVHEEILEYTGAATLRLRYPTFCVNYLATLATRFTETTFKNDDPDCGVDTLGDFRLNDDGSILLETATQQSLSVGDRISVHYFHHPVWVMWEHTHLTRKTIVKFKKETAELATPAGDLLELPGQVLVRLEHLSLDPS